MRQPPVEPLPVCGRKPRTPTASGSHNSRKMKLVQVPRPRAAARAAAGSQHQARGGLNILHLMPLSYGLYTFRYQNKLDLKSAPGEIC